MKCSRCGGLMVYENFYTLEIANLYEWRCVPCGEIVDKVILKNRSMQGVGAGRKVPGNQERAGKSLLRSKPSITHRYLHA
jgi:DNA-directed RNA polymerase subunit RPC12/RpoP